MPVKIIPPTPSAYPYPLLIKHLLHSPMVRSPDQEIVYRDLRRHTYQEFRERIGRLASGLSQIGVDQGDIVADPGMGQRPLSRCLLRHSDDRRRPCGRINVAWFPTSPTRSSTARRTVLFNADFLRSSRSFRADLKA